MTGGCVRVDRDGQVCTVEIDNPPLNVLNGAVRDALCDAVDRLAFAPEVRVVILLGAGERAFSAGADVTEFPVEAGPRGGREKILAEQRVYTLLAGLPQVTIAALRGFALGGGLELALACDLRIAAEDAQLGFPEAQLGVFPAAGGAQRALRLVGPAKAKELMLLCERIDAQEARRIGLVNRVVPAGALHDAARAMAGRLLGMSQEALRAIKTSIDRAVEPDLTGGMAADAEAFARLFAGPDVAEGVEAFRAKRPPRFGGAVARAGGATNPGEGAA